MIQAGRADDLVGAVEERRAQSLDDGEAEGELPPSEAGRRSAKEHCAADLAEEHGLTEAGYRANPRAGRGHIVVQVPTHTTLPPISA